MRQGSAASEYGIDVGRALVWAVRVGVMLIMLTPLIVSGGTLFPYVVGKAIYARVVIELTFALWLLLIFYYPQHRLPRSWILAAFGLWVAASLLAAFTGVSLTRSLWSNYERMQGIVDLAHWFAFTLIAVSAFRTFAHWRLLFTVSLLVCAAVTLVGISQYYGVLDLGLPTHTTNRLESTLGNPAYLSAYIIINTLIALGLIAHSLSDDTERNRRVAAAEGRARRRRRRRGGGGASSSSFDWLPLLQVFWMASIMLNLWAVWLTGTRSGFGALVAVAVIFSIPYLIWGRMRIVRWACAALAAVSAVALALFVILRLEVALPFGIQKDPTVRRIATMGLNDPSVSGRVNAIDAGYRAFLERPIVGWGPENFIVPWGRYVIDASVNRELFDKAHNKLVEELVTKGIVGLASYLLLWFAMMRALSLPIARAPGYEQVALFIFAMAMLAYFIQNLSLFDTPVGLMQFCVLAAFAAAAERRFREMNGQASAGWLPSRWTGGLRFGRISVALRSSWGAIGLSLCAAAVALAVVGMVNARMYSGAAATAQFLGAIGSEWDARVARFNDAVGLFPEMGEFPRILLMSEAMRISGSLSDEELRGAVELFERETRAQRELEPQNWRILVALADFYQAAAERDAAYAPIARERLESAREFAPNMVEQSYIFLEQGYLEGMR